MLFNIIEYPNLGSTNTELQRLLSEDNNLSEATVVFTQKQTCGRGQLTNLWHSEPYKNIAFSLLLKPSIDVQKHFDLNKMISVAIVSALEKIEKDIKIKWSNDIYFDNKKLGGLLIENSIISNKISHSIVGLGLNVNQEIFPDQLPNPISLFQIKKQIFDLNKLLSNILDSIKHFYELLKAENNDDINKKYLEKMYLLNKTSSFKNKQDNKIFIGEIIGTSPMGKLQIKSEEKILEFAFKEVEFLHDNN